MPRLTTTASPTSGVTMTVSLRDDRACNLTPPSSRSAVDRTSCRRRYLNRGSRDANPGCSLPLGGVILLISRDRVEALRDWAPFGGAQLKHRLLYATALGNSADGARISTAYEQPPLTVLK